MDNGALAQERELGPAASAVGRSVDFVSEMQLRYSSPLFSSSLRFESIVLSYGFVHFTLPLYIYMLYGHSSDLLVLLVSSFDT